MDKQIEACGAPPLPDTVSELRQKIKFKWSVYEVEATGGFPRRAITMASMKSRAFHFKGVAALLT